MLLLPWFTASMIGNLLILMLMMNPPPPICLHIHQDPDERKALVQALHLLKTDIVMELVESGAMPLRPGVSRLVRECYLPDSLFLITLLCSWDCIIALSDACSWGLNIFTLSDR